MLEKEMTRRFFLALSALAASAMAMDWKKLEARASRLEPKKDYPVVVIGAGLGGLCCGAYLSRLGLPVTVFEQHTKPGGYATAFNRDGFTFDVSLHGAPIHDTAAARILDDLGVREKLDMVELPEFYRLKTPEIDISIPQRDPEAYIRLLSRHFPGEERGIRGFVREMVGISEECQKFIMKEGKVFRLAFPLMYRKMWKVRNQTLDGLLDRFTKDPALRDVLSSLWGYYGLPPSTLSAFYYASATGNYLKNGSYYIMPRSRRLSNALAGAIESSGGKIIYRTAVENIIVDSGAVRGVGIRGGEAVPARAVVSNASAPETLLEMLPPGSLPAGYEKNLRTYRPSISSFIVWLGLDRDIRDLVRSYTIHVSSSGSPESDYLSCVKGEVEKGHFSVTVYDKLREGYSAPGRSTVMLVFLTGYGPWRRFEKDYLAGRKEAYRREKDRWTEVLIRRAEEQVIPELSSMVGVREAATPLTNRRFTRNAGGAIYGFEQSMDNSYMNRLDNRTPVGGLYLSSAWGSPGGGYAAVLAGGKTTFRKIMEDWGKA